MSNSPPCPHSQKKKEKRKWGEKREINVFEAEEGGAHVLFGNALFPGAYFDDFEQILFAGVPGTV